MIRTVNIKGKEYCVVNTTFTAYGIEAYTQINIDVSKLNAGDKLIIERNANLLFNRPLKISVKPKTQPEVKESKPWYKFW
jgi:hypothetical protein